MTPKSKLDLSKVDVEDFLEVMEVENVKKATEEEFNFSCPFSGHQHGDQSPSAYMNVETTAWMCHGCKRAGNAITFLSEKENISFQLATRYLRQEYGGASPDPDSHSVTAELERYKEKKQRREGTEESPILDEGKLKPYSCDWDALWHRWQNGVEIPPQYLYMLKERGFHPETLDRWQIGYDPQWDRITIPVRDQSGYLRGFKGRAWNDRKPKYLVLGGDKFDYPRHQKSHFVFGLYQALDWNFAAGSESLNLPEAIICEGELNAMALWEMGFENAVAVAGSELSDTQARLLRDYCDSAIIFFDSDEGGWSGTSIVIDALKDFMPLQVVPDHEHDPAEYLRRGEQDSVRSLCESAESITKIITSKNID